LRLEDARLAVYEDEERRL